MLLTGFQAGMPARQPRQCRPAPRAFAAATVLCLVLLALLAVIQAAHVHPLESDADHCPLCVVLHAVAPVAVTAAIIILARVGAPVLVSEPHVTFRPWLPTLFIRPPPAVA
jgi:hypothetical protein